jgi:LacI family transcriptional regulator
MICAKRPSPSHTPRVAVLLESSTSGGQLAQRGIVDYVRRHRWWSIDVKPLSWYERQRLPRGWKGDGIIGRVRTPALARQLNAIGVPVINVSYLTFRGSRIYQVAADQRAIGQMGAEHLMSRGFRHFAYCGPVSYPYYVDRIGEAFGGHVSSAGFSFGSYEQPAPEKVERSWRLQERSLGRWLQGLPKPLGVLAWNSHRGHQVIEACRTFGLRVPAEVAVLSAINDDLMCEITEPALSAIDHDPWRIGYSAAELLDRLMLGENPPAQPLLFAPASIVARQSTDSLAIDDAPIATALQFIMRHAHEPIGVGSVVEASCLSRRSLELRFGRCVGRSPAAEIRRLRIDRAKRLLLDTDLTVGRIAESSGFMSQEVMSRAFRRELATTPVAFRSAARNPGWAGETRIIH